MTISWEFGMIAVHSCFRIDWEENLRTFNIQYTLKTVIILNKYGKSLRTI